MPYSVQAWTDSVTPVDKTHMDHIESGIATADTNATTADGKATTALARVQVPTVVNGQWLKGVGGAAVWAALTVADVVTPQARVYNPGTPSLANGWNQLTTSLMGWTTDYDNDTIWDTTNGRMLIKTAGRYRVTLYVSLAPNATGVRALQITKNGFTSNVGVAAEASQPSASASVGSDLYASFEGTVAVNDFFVGQCFQNSAGSLSASTNPSSFFAVQRIG